MSQETTVILRSILYQLKESEDLIDAVMAVEAMCTKDDIAAVEQKIAEKKAKKAQLGKGR